MKTMMRKGKKGDRVLLFTLLLSVAAVFPLYSDIDNEFSLMYLNVADSFFKAGKYEDAEIFLNKALIYNQGLSDPYYISAVIEKQKNITESINLLKKSLTLRKWHIYSEADAFFELGILYNRVKDHERAIASLYSVKDDYIDNSDFLDAYTASLLRRGYFNEARELLDYALKKYPFANTFKKRLAGIDTDYLDNLIVKALDSENREEYDPGLLVSLAQLVSDKGVKKEIVENLEGRAYQSADLLLEKLFLKGFADKGDIETFADLGGFSNYMHIKKINDLIVDNDAEIAFRGLFSEYTGLIKNDLDKDGIDEILMSVNNGLPEWYSEDINQDNQNDLFVSFDNGKPQFISIGGNFLAAYYTYPYLKTVIFFGNNSSEVYNFKDRNAYFNIIDYSNPYIPPVLENDVMNMFSKISGKAESYRKSETGDRLNVLMKYFRTERITNYESYDSALSVLRRGSIRDGKVVFSKADMDNDSIFETREIYRDGKLESIKYDGNNNGIYEFKIENNVKYWDLNEDGTYDVREWKDNENISYSEFSTNLDGNFDFSARFIAGTLSEIRREGKWIAVQHDPLTNIFWIGVKCQGFGIADIPENLDMQGQYVECGDTAVYVVKIGGHLYAEVSD